LSGSAASIDELKAAVASINLAGLEALKNQACRPIEPRRNRVRRG